eukprot:1193919-Prorocentrum_minimum.AAC.5
MVGAVSGESADAFRVWCGLQCVKQLQGVEVVNKCSSFQDNHQPKTASQSRQSGGNMPGQGANPIRGEGNMPGHSRTQWLPYNAAEVPPFVIEFDCNNRGGERRRGDIAGWSPVLPAHTEAVRLGC